MAKKVYAYTTSCKTGKINLIFDHEIKINEGEVGMWISPKLKKRNSTRIFVLDLSLSIHFFENFFQSSVSTKKLTCLFGLVIVD